MCIHSFLTSCGFGVSVRISTRVTSSFIMIALNRPSNYRSLFDAILQFIVNLVHFEAVIDVFGCGGAAAHDPVN